MLPQSSTIASTFLGVGRTGRKWEKQVRKHFDFLLDCGFVFVGVDDSNFWEIQALYVGRRIGVQVADSRETARVEVDLIRLSDGHIPLRQVWVTDEPIARTLLDNVVEARSHPAADELAALSSKTFDEQLQSWARLLQEIAPEVIRDDDAPIADAERVIRRRVADHPQEMVVWLPHDASDERERSAVAEAGRDLPAGVELKVRRYQR